MEKIQVITELQEASRVDVQKMQAASRAENKKKIEKKLEAPAEKLQEIHKSVSKRITSVEEKVSILEKTVNTEIINLEKSVEGKLVMMKEKLSNLQSQRPARIVSEGAVRVKPPCFDGNSPLSVFKFQFAQKVILELKGAAAKILETTSDGSRNNYNDIMVALQRRFGEEHKRELYRMELLYRSQKANASLCNLGRKIGAAHIPGKKHLLVNSFKTEVFVNSIRDADIKLAVRSAQNITFAETVVDLALVQETARTISRPQVIKVRKMEV